MRKTDLGDCTLFGQKEKRGCRAQPLIQNRSRKIYFSTIGMRTAGTSKVVKSSVTSFVSWSAT